MMFKPPSRGAHFFQPKMRRVKMRTLVILLMILTLRVVSGKSHQSEPTHRGLGEDATSVFRPRVFSSAELKEGLNDESTQNELKEILRSDGILGVNTASGDFKNLKKTV